MDLLYKLSVVGAYLNIVLIVLGLTGIGHALIMVERYDYVILEDNSIEPVKHPININTKYRFFVESMNEDIDVERIRFEETNGYISIQYGRTELAVVTIDIVLSGSDIGQRQIEIDEGKGDYYMDARTFATTELDMRPYDVRLNVLEGDLDDIQISFGNDDLLEYTFSLTWGIILLSIAIIIIIYRLSTFYVLPKITKQFYNRKLH